MATARAARFAQGELASLADAGLDSFAYRRMAGRKLRRVVPFDAIWFFTTDPASSFYTSAMVDPQPALDVCRTSHVVEFVEDDFNQFADLARTRTVGVLSEATGGRLEESRRYREVLRPSGYEYELRTALVDGTGCWGAIALLREAGAPDFTPAESRRVAQLTGTLTEGLRVSILAGAASLEHTTEGPGLLVLNNRSQVVAATPAAERWLAELGESALGLPEPVQVVAVSARGPRDDTDAETPLVRVRAATGRWLAVHASRVESPGELDGTTAVIIEEAKPREVAELVVRAYGLSGREGEIATMVLRGMATREIAAELSLSPHTVQDHLKSVFDKVGVRSRRELVAQIFDQHHWPSYGEGERTPAADGTLRAA